MNNYFFNENQVLTIDLHCMKVWEAVLYLNKIVEYAPSYIREIIIIHGYQNGTKLLKMIRSDYSNPRIERKFLGLNPGRTSFIMKEEGKICLNH